MVGGLQLRDKPTRGAVSCSAVLTALVVLAVVERYSLIRATNGKGDRQSAQEIRCQNTSDNTGRKLTAGLEMDCSNPSTNHSRTRAK